jgi:hypothetical protein
LKTKSGKPLGFSGEENANTKFLLYNDEDAGFAMSDHSFKYNWLLHRSDLKTTTVENSADSNR